jgi:hypothetical protein
MTSQAPLVREYYAVVPAVSANADAETALFVAPFAGTITEVTYIADTAITGANTESRTLQVFNKGAAGSGTTKVAELAMTQGVDAAAFDEKAITLDTTDATSDGIYENRVCAADDVLVWKSLHIGSTGLADPGGTVKVKISRD